MIPAFCARCFVLRRARASDRLTRNDPPVKKEELKRLGIHYDFEKKRTPSPDFTRRTQNERIIRN